MFTRMRLDPGERPVQVAGDVQHAPGPDGPWWLGGRVNTLKPSVIKYSIHVPHLQFLLSHPL